MTTNEADSSNPLIVARDKLRRVAGRMQEGDPRGQDTGALERMRVHLGNITNSLFASTKDHVNAAKRLGDFADTLERMKKRLTPSMEDLAADMSAVADALRGAGAELENKDQVPAWASAEAPEATPAPPPLPTGILRGR